MQILICSGQLLVFNSQPQLSLATLLMLQLLGPSRRGAFLLLYILFSFSSRLKRVQGFRIGGFSIRFSKSITARVIKFGQRINVDYDLKKVYHMIPWHKGRGRPNFCFSKSQECHWQDWYIFITFCLDTCL